MSKGAKPREVVDNVVWKSSWVEMLAEMGQAVSLIVLTLGRVWWRSRGVLSEVRMNGQLQGLSCQKAEGAREPTSCGPARGDENCCCLILFQFLECPMSDGKGRKANTCNEPMKNGSTNASTYLLGPQEHTLNIWPQVCIVSNTCQTWPRVPRSKPHSVILR